MAGPIHGQEHEHTARATRLPAECGDDGLQVELAGIQTRARRLMDEHGIATGDMVSMAREAERSIGSEARRAEFLKLLIELHEFGSEAKRRGLLPSASPTRNPGGDRAANPEATPDRKPGTRLFDSSEAAGDEVDDDAARAFFDRLDR